MRIGIDGGCLSNRRGFGRFARQVVAALAEVPSRHEFVVFVDRPSLSQVGVPERFQTVAVEVREAPSRAASARGRRGVRDMLAMSRAVARASLDLLYFPATYSFFPVWNVPKVVVTMHDILAVAHPEWVFPTRRGRLFWRMKEHAAIVWADRILTVSETARRDLIAWFRLPAEQVGVVTEGPHPLFSPRPPGAESDAVLARYGLEPEEPYFLYVGGLSPHKNLIRLVEAFDRLDAPGVRLVLVGDTSDPFHTHLPQIREAVARLGLGSRVLFPGFVPDEDLAFLYSRGYALVQPSLWEGFGLPPVEAMACGAPVLCSDRGSLPEVVGTAGRYFDPTDVGAIARTMEILLREPGERDRLAAEALERSHRFRWERAAEALLDQFDQLDGTQRGRIPA